ncbi:ABC transporter ATP-binding protein [Brevibacillus reuszeri]|uniref:ABC transporter ATP-binding protein n=1 Tax=Brevibacillus reuszeri TaxID=54915 RepID=UPI00289FDB2C|nr:ATP-binding cassette domain-containing protein [Brevibacillus reuszeri]
MHTSIEIESLGKQFDSPSGQWLFRNVDAKITEPTTIGVLGKSGQGKSTLLRILGRLIPPDSGTVRLNQKDISQWDPAKWRMKMSYVAQHAVMLPGSVEDNLRTVSTLHQRPFDQKHARDLLEQLYLDNLDWSKSAQQLSGGEKQRLALVRTLLLQPEILLLDEVTASLDALSKQAAERLLIDLHTQTGTTLIWITHDLEEARIACKRIWFMANHELHEDAPREAFFHAPQTVAAKDFLRNQKTMVAAAEEGH